VDPANFAALDDYLMPARLAPYLQACDGDEAKARRLYVWNIEVSAAFWGPISGVEIAFRNVLHHEFVRHFGRTDWWRHHSVNRDDVKSAIETEERLQRQRARIRGAAPLTADDVVAALSFGFWSSILGGPSKALEQRKYWHLCLHRAFPRWAYRPGADNRKSFLRRVEMLRKFRNRVAHHEPVHGRDLLQDHVRLVELADFMHDDLARFIQGHSRVAGVLERRDAAVNHGECQF
jgi:hypothetical protein